MDWKLGGLAVFALLLGACTQMDSDQKAAAAIAEVQNDLEAAKAENEAVTAELMQRLDSLQASVEAAKLTQNGAVESGSTGDWIIWKTYAVGANPRNIVFGYRKPEPAYAYASQAECIEVATRNVRAMNGNESAQFYSEDGQYGATWIVTFKCLPKGVDPR